MVVSAELGGFMRSRFRILRFSELYVRRSLWFFPWEISHHFASSGSMFASHFSVASSSPETAPGIHPPVDGGNSPSCCPGCLGRNSISMAAAKVAPAVVNISNVSTVQGKSLVISFRDISEITCSFTPSNKISFWYGPAHFRLFWIDGWKECWMWHNYWSGWHNFDLCSCRCGPPRPKDSFQEKGRCFLKLMVTVSPFFAHIHTFSVQNDG